MMHLQSRILLSAYVTGVLIVPGSGFTTVSSSSRRITGIPDPFVRIAGTSSSTTNAQWVHPSRRSSPSMQLSAIATDEKDTTADSTGTDTRALDQALEEGSLRNAVTALKLSPRNSLAEGGESQQPHGEDVPPLSREQWDQIFQLIEERTANAQENDSENLRALAEFPATSAARNEMTDMYKMLRERGHLTLFGAMNAQEPLAAGSYQVPPPLLEGILDLPMKALTPQPTNSLLIAGMVVALLESVASFALGIPMVTLLLWSLFLVTFDRLFLNGASFESFLKLFSPGVQEKILRHEAGHFLAAYLLGCPVEGIVLSAWAALRDKRFGVRNQVSAGTSFFDPQLSDQINNRQRVTQSAVDRYSIIVMAGIAAEADWYGRADGGAGDETSLVAFLSQLNLGSNNRHRWNSDSIRNRARWGALQAVLLLREYKPAYDALVDALERGGTLGDCIYAIERAARQNNLKPVQHPLGYIVERDSTDTASSSSYASKEVVWRKYSEYGALDTSSDSTALPATTTNGEQEVRNGERQAGAAPVGGGAVVEMDEETMKASLQQYRSQVETKLREVEQKLDELENS